MRSLLTGLLFLLTACGTTTKSVRLQPNFKLRQCKNVYLVLKDSTGGTSFDVAQVINGEKNGGQFLSSLELEMTEVGFIPQTTQSKADCTAEFSLMGIRKDPITGWICDQALVKFIDKDVNMAMSIRGQSRGITPTVDNMISNVVSEMKREW